jgi:hypothetical protein
MWKIITSSNNRMISAQNKSASNISVLRENQTLQPKHDTSLHYDKNNFLNLQFAPWYIGISTPALYNSIQSGTLQDAPEDIGAVPGIHNYKKHLCCPVKVPLCATCISSHQTPMFTWRCSIWKLEANYYIPVKPPHEVSLSKLHKSTWGEQVDYLCWSILVINIEDGKVFPVRPKQALATKSKGKGPC